MAKRKIQIIPPDGGYVDVLHPETSADQVITTDGKNVETKLGELNSGKANTSHNHTKANITDFPTTMPPSTHTHAYSPTSHASTGTGYGVGTTANYGHCKTINGLTQTSHSNGFALSAYQGKVLNDKFTPVTGSYTGNDTAGRVINLGFRPSFVLVQVKNDHQYYGAIDGSPSTYIEIVSNGFQVGDGFLNRESQSPHHYVAYK